MREVFKFPDFKIKKGNDNNWYAVFEDEYNAQFGWDFFFGPKANNYGYNFACCNGLYNGIHLTNV